MKIVFICGSLEPGRDGVGDYIRCLCGELLRNNHQASIIALNDKHLSEHVLERGQLDKEQSIHTLRLSSQSPWSARISRAKTFIEFVDPDWISLQYVSFAFHNKGLPFKLVSVFKHISKGRQLHIMFHELWVGMSVQSSKWHILWGLAQRYLIQLLLDTLHPDVIHTHALLYKIQLNKLGVQTSLLPLFPNIPTTSRMMNFARETFKEENKITFVIFGGLHAGAPVDQLADEVKMYAFNKKVIIDLTIIGRSSTEQEIWISAWRSCGLTVNRLGEQSPENVSKVLSQSSIGLSTTPIALAEKSSAIASMHAHGLPILCVSQPWQPRNINELRTAMGVFQYSIGNLELFMNNCSSMSLPAISVTDISQKLINSLLLIETEQAKNN